MKFLVWQLRYWLKERLARCMDASECDFVADENIAEAI